MFNRIWISQRRLCTALVGLIFSLPLTSISLAADKKDQLFILAAASTIDVLDAIKTSFLKSNEGVAIKIAYGSSANLARQVLKGIKADIYISANRKWMDRVEKAGHIKGEDRTAFLLNRLILVSARHTDRIPGVASARNVHRMLNGRRFIMADPAHVPLGKYAQQALFGMAWWERLKPEMVLAQNARAAVNLIIRTGGVGIVYQSALKISPRLHVLHSFAEHLHEEILYEAALLGNSPSPVARRFIQHLQSPPAQKIAADFGFLRAPAQHKRP